MNLKYDIQDGSLIITVEQGYADSSSVMIPLEKLAKGLDEHITHPKPVACKCKCDETKKTKITPTAPGYRTAKQPAAKKEKKD